MLSCPTQRAGAGPTTGPLPVLIVRFPLPEKTFQHEVPPKTRQDVAADSNTPDLLEQCSQDSPERSLQGEPVQTSSPSLLCSYSHITAVETTTAQTTSAAEAACDAPCAARSPEVSGDSEATLPALSPAFSIAPSSRSQCLPEGTPHREQADSSGTALPPDTLKRSPACGRTRGGGAAGAKRKLLAGDGHVPLALGGQQHLRGAPWGRERDTGRRLELLSAQRAKKSRKEETGLRHGKELEEEQASPASGPSSRPEQRRALQPVKMKQLVGSPKGWSSGRFSVSPHHRWCPSPRPFLTWLVGMGS